MFFGPGAEYVVCVNTIDIPTAKQRVGAADGMVDWHDSNPDLPMWLLLYIDSNMADGVAWKFAPVRLFPDCHSLSLDNDVVLWSLPDSIRDWMQDGDSLLTAEDVKACYGKFADFSSILPRNSSRSFRPRHRVVTLQEVSVSGYFRPHMLELGACGAHFVGVNAKHLPWTWNGRSGEEYIHEYWDCKKTDLY